MGCRHWRLRNHRSWTRKGSSTAAWSPEAWRTRALLCPLPSSFILPIPWRTTRQTMPESMPRRASPSTTPGGLARSTVSTRVEEVGDQELPGHAHHLVRPWNLLHMPAVNPTTFAMVVTVVCIRGGRGEGGREWRRPPAPQGLEAAQQAPLPATLLRES